MTYNPKSLSQIFSHISTPLQAIESEAESLFVLRRVHGDIKVAALIKLYLIELNELLNLKRPLTEKMIDCITEELLAQYSALNMADIHLVFRRAKTGKLGAFYEALSMPKVLSWFSDYFNERCMLSAQRSIDESEQYKKLNSKRSCETSILDDNFRKQYLEKLTKIKNRLVQEIHIKQPDKKINQ